MYVQNNQKINKRRLKETYGFKHVVDLKIENKSKKIMHYECKKNQSVGRAICYILKRIKKIDPKTYNALVIYNIEETIFKRNPKTVISRYKRIYSAGNQTKGPFTPKSEVGLFKKLLRNNLKYKSKDKVLFKKICVLANKELNLLKYKNSTNIITQDKNYRTKENIIGEKINLKTLIEKI